MKFKLKDKEFDIKPASARSVIEIEKKIGLPLAKMGDNPSFTHVQLIFTAAILQSTNDPEVTEDWILDNTQFAMLNELSEVVADFLALKPN
jgi:hypothetical protein